MTVQGPDGRRTHDSPLYRVLLRLLPRRARRDFGVEMETVFCALRREARREGRLAVGRLWLRTLRDLAVNAVLLRVGRGELYEPDGSGDRRGVVAPTRDDGPTPPPFNAAGNDSGGTSSLVDGLRHDLRTAARTLRRSPGYAAAVILVLAVAIGANTAIFSVVDAVLLAPLPYPDADRLVQIWTQFPQQGEYEFPVSRAEFVDYREESELFGAMAAYWPISAVLTGQGEPEELQVAAATTDIWTLLGAETVAGRTFTAEETRPGNDDVVVLGHSLWQRRFGGDPAVVGRRISLNDQPHTVVGVLAPDVRLPRIEVDAFAPLAIDEAALEGNRSGHPLAVLGRMKPRVGLEQVRTEMGLVVERWQELYSHVHPFHAVTLREQVVGDVRRPLIVLFAAVAALLLVACANVAALTMARAEARQREIDIRAALGASPRRLVRQLLIEAGLLAAIGSSLGIALAAFGTDALLALEPGGLPRIAEVGIHGGVLAFTLLLTLFTAVAFGTVPALRASRRGVEASSLRGEGERGATGPAGGRRFRHAMVLAQTALAVTLVIAAGLLVRSLGNLLDVDPGVRPEGVLTAETTLPRARYGEPESVARFHRRLIDRLEAIPGVEAAGLALSLPFVDPGVVEGFLKEGESFDEGDHEGWRELELQIVTPGYFRTLGIPVVSGRALTAADRAGDRRVAVINEALVRRHYAGEEPLGREIRILAIPEDREEPFEIVGVVGDVRRDGLDQETPAQVYLPAAQAAFYHPVPTRYLSLTVRSETALAPLGRAVEHTLWELDPDLALANVRPLQRALDESVARPRFVTVLLGTFSGLTLLLAAAGVYSMVAFGVARRTREMGLRMALGARRGQLLRMVVGQGMAPALAGIALGTVGALFLSRTLSSLLYGVRPFDPATFAVATACLAVVALVAAWLPARRATRVDPLVALRTE